MKYVTSKEVTAKFAASTGYLRVRKSSADNETMKNSLADESSLYAKVYPVAQKSLEYSLFTPAVNNEYSARNVAMEKYEAYVTGNIADVDTFIK